MKYEIFEIYHKRSTHLSWLKDRTIFLTRTGSHSYGTNIATSDIDLKGVCIAPKDIYFSPIKNFEQAELNKPDCTIFEIKKIFRMLSGANPNSIELLFTDPSDHLLVSPLGEILLQNRDKFLSKRIRFSFAGYAHSQLSRLKLHRSYLRNPIESYPTRKEMGLPEKTLIPKDQFEAAEACIKKELDKYQFDFLEGYSEDQKIEIKSNFEKILLDLKISSEDKWLCAARKIGIDDNFIFLMQKEREYVGKKLEYDRYQEWKENRNKERALLESKFQYDTKHAYHLIRLIRMCEETLTTGKVIVKRPDAEELLHIRNGGWSLDQIIEYSDKKDKELEVLYKSCNVLPHSVNQEELNNLCVSIIEKSFE